MTPPAALTPARARRRTPRVSSGRAYRLAVDLDQLARRAAVLEAERTVRSAAAEPGAHLEDAPPFDRFRWLMGEPCQLEAGPVGER